MKIIKTIAKLIFFIIIIIIAYMIGGLKCP